MKNIVETYKKYLLKKWMLSIHHLKLNNKLRNQLKRKIGEIFSMNKVIKKVYITFIIINNQPLRDC